MKIEKQVIVNEIVQKWIEGNVLKNNCPTKTDYECGDLLTNKGGQLAAFIR